MGGSGSCCLVFCVEHSTPPDDLSISMAHHHKQLRDSDGTTTAASTILEHGRLPQKLPDRKRLSAVLARVTQGRLERNR